MIKEAMHICRSLLRRSDRPTPSTARLAIFTNTYHSFQQGRGGKLADMFGMLGLLGQALKACQPGKTRPNVEKGTVGEIRRNADVGLLGTS
jgi:hypothetical protein